MSITVGFDKETEVLSYFGRAFAGKPAGEAEKHAHTIHL